jgi:ATP-dependent helicase/nuclease subunit A
VDRSADDAIMEFIQREIFRMLEKGLLTEDMSERLNPYGLKTFLKTSIALDMAKADAKGNLFREKPFVMEHNDVLVQGIIDVFWIMDDKIVLLDYKTDNVSAKEELIARYKDQLELYADVLKRLFLSKDLYKGQDSVEVESLIYSFKLKEVISI